MKRDKKPGPAEADRRAFLATSGKFAIVTPPMITTLLSTSLTSPAIAASGKEGAPKPVSPLPPRPPRRRH